MIVSDLLQRLPLLLLLITPSSILGLSTPNTPPPPIETLKGIPLETLEGTTRYRGRAAYDGNGFQGFQLQPDRRTIQGELEEVLARRFQRLVRVVGASRTDAGVHARGQAIHFDLKEGEIESQQDLEKLQRSMNSMLRQDLQVYNLQEAPVLDKEVNGILRIYPWNAMLDSTGKLYIYRLSAAKSMDPLERHNRYDTKWKDTNVDVLERTLKHFEGSHDFRAFAGGIEQMEKRMKGGTMNTRRQVYSIDIVDEGAGMYRIEVRLKGALYKMIRNMVGTALDVAWGHLSEEDFLALLHRTEAAGRTQNKSKPAPPEGLTLEQVYYEDF
jgi:tRNA pseudouridine38-40 synthase